MKIEESYADILSVADAMVKLSDLIIDVRVKMIYATQQDFLFKTSPEKWSKQEVLGHLIDSAINNLKRFTEIQFLPQPYVVQAYQQNELVQINRYQNQQIKEVYALWKALNEQIVVVVKATSKEKLGYKAVLPNGEEVALEWLIFDYIAHIEHHLKGF